MAVPSLGKTIVGLGGEVSMFVNVAVIVVLLLMDKVHIPIPEHSPPDQPSKILAVSGNAVRVMKVPEL